MGTNYYMRYKSKTCECCNRTDEEVHIGKSSHGWTFSFKGYANDTDNPRIEDIEDWVFTLSDKDTYIVNEYEDIVDKDEFWTMVHEKALNKDNKNHSELYNSGNWLDKSGHSFNGGEFS